MTTVTQFIENLQRSLSDEELVQRALTCDHSIDHRIYKLDAKKSMNTICGYCTAIIKAEQLKGPVPCPADATISVGCSLCGEKAVRVNYSNPYPCMR